MLSRRSLFRLAVVAPPAAALALALPVAAAGSGSVIAGVVQTWPLARLASHAMGLLGLIDLPGGEVISAADFSFVKAFIRPGMSPEDLARRIEPYYMPHRYGR